MANTFPTTNSPFNPVTYGAALHGWLRKKMGMAALVNRQLYEGARRGAMNKGDKIEINRPQTEFTVRALGTGTADSIRPTTAILQIDEAWEVNMKAEDVEATLAGGDLMIDSHLEPLAAKLAAKVDEVLMNRCLDIPFELAVTGETNTVIDPKDVPTAKKKLRAIGVPTVDNRMFCGVTEDGEAALLKNTLFHDAQLAGQDSAMARVNGSIGAVRFNTEFFAAPTVPSYTAGTTIAGDAAGTVADAAINATSLTLENLTDPQTITPGTILQIAGHDVPYAVTGSATTRGATVTVSGSAATVGIAPELLKAVTGDPVVTLVGTAGKLQPLFPREAFDLVMVTLPDNKPGHDIFTMVDRELNVSFRVSRGWSQTTKTDTVSVDAVFGVLASNPHWAVRLVQP